EKDRIGGECLQAGCIPSKSLISVARLLEKVKHSQGLGIKVSGLEIDTAVMQQWKRGVIKTLEGGIESLCKGYGVQIARGEAEIRNRSLVVVRTQQPQQQPPSGSEEFKTKNIVIATGSRAVALPGIEFDGEVVISSREALALEKIPERLLVVGGGYI